MLRILYKHITQPLRCLRYSSKCHTYLNQLNNAAKWSQIYSKQFQTTSFLLSDDIITVKAPAFPDSISSGDVKLFKKKGDFVKQDEVVLEIETDKTTGAITAPQPGIIEEFLVQHEAVVTSQQALFKLKVTAGDAAQAQPEAGSTPTPSEPPKPTSSGEIITVKAPRFPDSISSGDIKLMKKTGDFVKQDELILEIETDKTTGPIAAPKNGIIEQLLVKDGEAIQSEQALFKFKISSEAPPGATAAPSKADETPKKAPPKPSPVAEKQIDPSMKIQGTRSEKAVKMSRMRLKIAERLKQSQNTYAMLTTFNEVDMSYIMKFRKTNSKAFLKKHDAKLGLMSPFIKASAYALEDQPNVNAVIDGNSVIYRNYIDISIAMATPKGLAVPVIKNVQNMNYPDIERALAALANKGRKNLLEAKDMEGGTFTITNGGVFGSLLSMPIINPPQSSILGMHGIFDRPVVNNKKIVIKPMMYICLTYDHRLIDGREAVLFLRTIKGAVEDPRTILAAL